MAVELRILKENEMHLGNDFFNRIYKTNRSMKDFSWEFLEGPNGKAIYIAAVDTSASPEKVVGIQCATPLFLRKSNGQNLLTAKSEDTLVDPEYRGQKIFERMYELLFDECKKAGIHYIWGFTPAKKAFERIGFEIPYSAHQALMVFNPYSSWRYLSNLNPENKSSDKLKIAVLSCLSWVASLKRLAIGIKSLEVLKVPIQSMNESLQSLYPDSDLYFLNMDQSYIQWRITNNPAANNYESYRFFESGNLVAEVLINIRGNVGFIEQLLFTKNISESVAKSIIKKNHWPSKRAGSINKDTLF